MRGKGNPQEDVEGGSQDRSYAPGLEGNRFWWEPIRGPWGRFLQEQQIDRLSDHLNILKRDLDKRQFGVELVVSSQKTKQIRKQDSYLQGN